MSSPPKPGPASHLDGYKFRPGRSGNPGGRPKGQSLTAAIREVLERTNEAGQSLRELLAERIVAQAIDGDVAAQKEVLNRLDGKATEPAAPDSRKSLAEIAAALEISACEYAPERKPTT